MNKIHPLSLPTPVSDLDLFTVPPTQESIEKNFLSEHRPISTVNSSSVIEFNVTPGIDEYIQLRDTMLYLKLKIDIKKAAGGDVTADDWKKVNIVNNFMHSLFRTIDLEINGKSITMNPQTYAYKAYLESAYGYTTDAQYSHLTSVGYFEDESKKEEVNDKQEFLTPSTIKTDGTGKVIDLMGKLHLDLAFQPKALLGGTKIKLTLIPNDPKFYIWLKDDTIVPSVTFQSASLFVARSKVSPLIVEAHNVALTKGTAKYPIMRSNVKSFTINTGSNDIMIDNAIHGQIPRRVILGLVSNKAFSGDILENPYNFKHFNLNYLAANIDGVQYPTVAYQPDFTNELYIREFLSVFEAFNQITSDSVIKYERNFFDQGNALYGFNFSLDGTDDCHKVGYVNPTKTGSLGFHLKFSRALTEPINVIMYCEYDNLIEIDANRDVITDYL